jgi:prepilin peptidase CpaA
MHDHSFISDIAAHWSVWLVAVTLVVAAVIDGWQLRVPNWLTYPMIISGWIFGIATGGWAGFGESLLGTAVGLACLLPLYAIGGMGAGDVKLLAGVGAWLGAATTFYGFLATAITGGVIAIVMVLVTRSWKRHQAMFLQILGEVATIGNPTELSAIAQERKSTMSLLPYGIPIAIGCIIYFFWAGLLL